MSRGGFLYAEQMMELTIRALSGFSVYDVPPDSLCFSLSHSAGPLYLESVAESIIEKKP